MTSRLGKKEKLILFSGLFLILAFTAFGYFIFIQPLKTNVQQKETELETQQKLLEVIETREIETPVELAQSSVNLQKHIPVKALLEQFIIDLEMAETVSNSQILSVSFSDEGTGETETTPTTYTTTQATDGTGTGTTNESQTIQKPEGIKEITIDLTIESESYYDLEKFIDTLEKLDRIVEINSVSFSGPPEVSSVGTGTDQTKTSFSLSLSIFYFPKLQDLVEELPEIETEPPANKSNPLSNFSDVSEEHDAKNE
jgi:type IV pilus assembly protein PilO